MKTTVFLLLIILIGCKSETGNLVKSSDGIDLYYETHGLGEPTLVFVPGWSCDATAWKDQISYFKDKYHVVALDLPGFGRSGSQRGNWSMEKYGEDVAELAKELNLDNIILVGHSMGGPVVLEAAKDLQDKVKGVVLVDILQTLNYSIDSASIINFYNDFSDNYKKYEYIYTYHKNDSLRANRYLKMMPAADDIPKSWFPILKEIFRWMNEDCIQVVSEIQIPIRAINSDQSETNIEEWIIHSKDFKVIVIENAGHYLNWEYPDKFNYSLNEFIQDLTK